MYILSVYEGTGTFRPFCVFGSLPTPTELVSFLLINHGLFIDERMVQAYIERDWLRIERVPFISGRNLCEEYASAIQ